MQAVCGHCGEAMIAGNVFWERDARLIFVVSAGTPTSWNPFKAVVQGIRKEPDYREEAYPIGARVCSRCGRFEFFLEAADLSKANALVTPPNAE